MKYHLLILIQLLWLPALSTQAQQENIWIFGNHIGFDFNSGSCVPFATPPTGMRNGYPAASVCNDKGELLFYTNGESVWNRNHQMMPNGEYLVKDANLPSAAGPSFTYVSGAQGDGATIIIPMPDNPKRYYIFYVTHRLNFPYSGRLYYSIIDMTLDNGLGDIYAESVLLDADLVVGSPAFSPFGYQLTGVAGTKCNVWLLATARAQGQATELRAYNISGDGIDSIAVVSPILIKNKSGHGSQIVVSPNRKKLAYAGNAMLYDFDPFSGTISNPIQLEDNSDIFGHKYKSVAFSPDNTKLYATGTMGASILHQFDITSGIESEILSTRTIIENLYGFMKLGPDGKIYISQQSIYSPFLNGTINNPNEKGLACNYIPNTPYFAPGSRSNGYSLPNVVPVILRDTLYSTFSDSFAACATAVLKLSPKDTFGWGYQWSTGDSSLYLNIDSQGVYWVTYYNSPCVLMLDTFYVKTFQLPLQDLGKDTLFCAHIPVQLRLKANNLEHAALQWSNGSNESSIVVADTGMHWVSLSLPPCVTSDSIYIGRQICECTIIVPNAFSPNNDGVNDLFQPYIQADCPNIKKYSLSIYNRYGQRIYSSVQMEDGWNGTFNAIPVDIGTYYFEIQLEAGTKNKPYYQKGALTLIR